MSTRRLFRLVMQDEARHVGYGMQHLRWVLDHFPEKREIIHRHLDEAENFVFGGGYATEVLEPFIILSGKGLKKENIAGRPPDHRSSSRPEADRGVLRAPRQVRHAGAAGALEAAQGHGDGQARPGDLRGPSAAMAYFAGKDFFEDPELMALQQRIMSGDLTLGWYEARDREGPLRPAPGPEPRLHLRGLQRRQLRLRPHSRVHPQPLQHGLARLGDRPGAACHRLHDQPQERRLVGRTSPPSTRSRRRGAGRRRWTCRGRSSASGRCRRRSRRR